MREGVGVFDIAEVRGIEFDVAGAEDVFREKMCVGGRGGRVVRARDDKSGRADSAKLLAKVKVADRRAVRDVAFWVSGFQHFLNWRYCQGIFCPKGGSEPALDGSSLQGYLLEFRVFRFRLLQDRDVGVGVLPEREEVLIGGLCLGFVSRQDKGSS